ncbi:unnamed protein product [Musa acuminata subsp. malaccensis]|uniref:(wild Malaysian banana) hypothetical protein n=1 Tax=Musa acuminata subsp. malaccensis TaxID=214687 RepID=A0A804K0H7_MUSAM|nr:unnamed protein product [Musa acuminata subsp. malaccensis]
MEACHSINDLVQCLNQWGFPELCTQQQKINASPFVTVRSLGRYSYTFKRKQYTSLVVDTEAGCQFI